MDTDGTASQSSLWKNKILAFLHDPPEKALDIAWHRKRAEAHQSGLELEDASFTKTADHTAAAADRLPWPRYSFLECSFDGETNHFKHPLGKASLKISPFATADSATDKVWDSRPILHNRGKDENFDRTQFFAYWRLWRWWASDHRLPKDPRMAFLPADTRLPDHTIWAHNSLVSGLQACVSDGKCQPAFLLFNIGPVQDFIAASRRTLDLWSGSYLLSYLTGSALRHIALTLGPDQIIFPNLCGQPIMDLLLRKDVWDKGFTSQAEDAKPLWESLGYDKAYARRRLLTPSLPNRFLALVPAPQAEAIGKELEMIVRETLQQIAGEVWTKAEKTIHSKYAINNQKDRFFAQVERHLEIAWQVQKWPLLPDEAIQWTQHLPKDAQADPQASLQTILDLASKMPKEHRDARNFDCEKFSEGSKKEWKDKSKLTADAKLDNPGAAWSALYSLVNWQLDAVRQNRAWKAWIKADETVGPMQAKDSLTGKEEAILNLATGEISDKLPKQLGEQLGSPWLFKKGEIVGAMTLIKRLWTTAWLIPKHDFKPSDFIFPDTRQIADGEPFPKQESGDDDAASESGNPYFAVLAFDGDEMGKWISGSHPAMPKLGEILADYHENGERKGAKKYFEECAAIRYLLDRPRPLNPSFHLQFSEMLGTFSNVCARRIVEAFDGCLIYSGGDDVLALLPSGQALACAQALRAAFQGTTELNKVKGGWEVDRDHSHREKKDLQLFDVQHDGFIQLHSGNYLVMDGEPKNFPAIVPGPATECSVGIAIAHFKSPLQDVVRAAQSAEKRAKGELGRTAVAISLFKRSGEISEWGCRWTSGGINLYTHIAEMLGDTSLSVKFPHRVCELLEPYLTNTTDLSKHEDANDFDGAKIISAEFSHAIKRQSKTGKCDANLQLLTPVLDEYLKQVENDWRKKAQDNANPPKITLPQTLLRAMIGLCTTVAFAHRTRPESNSAEKQTTP